MCSTRASRHGSSGADTTAATSFRFVGTGSTSGPKSRAARAVLLGPVVGVADRKKKGSKGGRPVSHDADLYKERNTVERLINKLKASRGIATRYDKTSERYLAGLHLRGAVIWIKDLTQAH